ncbi:peptide ligase PGM1-related protein [Paraburkholderia aromaticivorans]|uniref:ATP-grasp domain-containing protein n=1 Tax=Paraburkholderia aromaticivorans TaxID=2026199 RepID=A0A248VYY2_9BURK|nr:peptide ligase PGM1-related protein [Paraburkholderia aromaticivorans]ASW03742.1 hypothetical protein CJU94_36745 [Paraburkholderia aromaticivorans]
MPKLLIANLDNPSMMGDQYRWSPDFYRSSTTLAMRHAWFAEPGDIVVLPRPLSHQMQIYIAELMEYDDGDVTFLAPELPSDFCGPMGLDILLGSDFLPRVREAIDTDNEWTIWPYYHDRDVDTFVNALGIRRREGTNPFLSEGGAELFNDKRIFRAMAAGRLIPIADGCSVSSLIELSQAVQHLIEVTGSVIVKQDRHSSTDGNLVVTKVRGISGQGASEVLEFVGNGADALNTIWERLGYEGAALVVEAYYPVKKILYAEFLIERATSSVHFRNWGSPRMNPGCFGLTIPPGEVPPFLAAKFISGATEVARIACDLGFDGLLDVDGIVTSQGDVIFNEVNGRTGGCSHVHAICEKLLGKGYGNRAVAATSNEVRTRSLSRLMSRLRETGLAFDKRTQRGVVITAEDANQSGRLEALSIGKSEDEVLEVEASLIRLTQESISSKVAA